VSVELGLYRLGTLLLEPWAPMILRGRTKRGKEDPERIRERLGHAGATRPDGDLIWLHGASVGESLSLLPLLERLRHDRPDVAILVTSGTTTAAELLARRLPAGAIHQYIPIDAPVAATRFLDQWRPAVGVFVESELWPNLLLTAHKRGVKLALLSARIGEASAGGWAKAPGAARRLFAAFDLILPQDDAQAARLKALGARDDGRLNLKFAGEPLPVDAAALAQAQSDIGARPLLLAASTHPGEDELALDAFATVATGGAAPLLVLVPRHPARGPAVQDLAHARGFTAALRSAGESPADPQVYVADTLGELGLWFRLARTALIGGSLVPDVGGHNPLEAAQLGCPAVTGSHFDSWRSVFAPLIAAGDVTVVETPADLAAVFAQAIQAKDEARAQATLALIAEKTADLDIAFAQVEALLP
jgi:3-deoxy-D-manno-octulosonic-acid transferase